MFKGNLIKILLLIALTVLLASCLSGCFVTTECTHNWSDATCTEPSTCTICGETDGFELGHEWSDATCTSAKRCTRCNRTQGKALGHDWSEATCTSPQTCSRCYKTQGTVADHIWEPATCYDPEYCLTCGETRGEPLNHSATITVEGIEPTCTEVGYTTSIKCLYCGEYIVEPQEIPAQHSEEAVWCKLLSVHYQVYPCCGEKASEDEAHHKINGICDICGYDPTLTISSTTAQKGATVTIVVSVADNPGVVGMQLTFEYDESVMTLINVSSGEAFSALDFIESGNYSSGSKVLWDGLDLDVNDIKDGEILIFTFAIDPNAAIGDYNVLVKVKAYNNDLEPISFKINNGVITVTE